MGNRATSILLVDDEAIIAVSEKRKLEAEGYQVLLAYTGEQAAALVDSRREDIDLLLMDIDLGSGMDGTEAARLILGRHDIPILFLSSHTEREVVRKTEAITNYGYVVKSSSLTVLDASIKMALKLFEAQRRLALSEDKFAKAFHVNPDGININRLSDGVYIDINEGFTRMAGYTKEDVLGRSSLPGDLGVWVHAEDRERYAACLRERGSIENMETEFRRKDGSIMAATISGRLIEVDGQTCVLAITRDMSAREEAERLLRGERERLANVIAGAELGTWEWDIGTGAASFDEKSAALLGYGPADLPLRDLETWLGLKHPDDAAASLDLLGHHIAGDTAHYALESRMRHKDGSWRWILAHAKVIERGEDGEPLRIFGIHQDVTPRKRLEEALRESEAQLRSIANNLPAFVAVVEPAELRYRFVNSQYEKAFGLRSEDILGRTICDILGSANFRLALPHIEAARSGRTTSYEAAFELPLGKRWIQVNYIPQFEASGKLDSILILNTDITERVQAEEGLVRITAAFDSTSEAIGISDSRGRHIYHNRAHTELFGYATAEELEAAGGGSVCEKDPVLAREIFEAIMGGNKWSGEVEMVAKDGRTFPAYERADAIRDRDGGIIGLVGLVHDISERKALEARIRANEERLKALMLELEHRVKNSLAVVSSLLSIARMELPEGKAKSVLADTESRIQSMSALYERLYLSGEADSVEFGAYLEGLARSLFETYAAGAEGISLEFEVEDLELDTRRAINLGLIANELLTNAMKYAFPQGRRGRILVRFGGCGDKLLLRVSDDGVGLGSPGLVESSSSMGMMLIREFSRQIEGKIEVDCSAGTSIGVSFSRR
jgi:PAS domain S-box-containing protein